MLLFLICVFNFLFSSEKKTSIQCKRIPLSKIRSLEDNDFRTKNTNSNFASILELIRSDLFKKKPKGTHDHDLAYSPKARYFDKFVESEEEDLEIKNGVNDNASNSQIENKKFQCFCSTTRLSLFLKKFNKDHQF